MDILKELQLFDDAPNDVEINTLLGEGCSASLGTMLYNESNVLGQRALTLHRSKSTEDLNSPEERASLDIYRCAFLVLLVYFTGVTK